MVSLCVHSISHSLPLSKTSKWIFFFYSWQVDQLFRAQLFHDRKQFEERRRMSPADRAKTPCVDYLSPALHDVGGSGEDQSSVQWHPLSLSFFFPWLPYEKWSSPKRVPLFSRATEQLRKETGEFLLRVMTQMKRPRCSWSSQEERPQWEEVGGGGAKTSFPRGQVSSSSASWHRRQGVPLGDVRHRYACCMASKGPVPS